MNRREFFGSLIVPAAAALILPPATRYFLPPAGGWLRPTKYRLFVVVDTMDESPLPIRYDLNDLHGGSLLIEDIATRNKDWVNWAGQGKIQIGDILQWAT